MRERMILKGHPDTRVLKGYEEEKLQFLPGKRSNLDLISAYFTPLKIISRKFARLTETTDDGC